MGLSSLEWLCPGQRARWAERSKLEKAGRGCSGGSTGRAGDGGIRKKGMLRGKSFLCVIL